MQVPLEWSHRGLERNEVAIAEPLVRQLVSKLERLVPGIIACRVAVERTQKNTRHGSPYRVRIEVTLPPGKSVIATRGPEEHGEFEPMETVIRRTFSTMTRELKQKAELRRGDVKPRHASASETGFIVRMFPEDGYGFIKTVDGREIYMHQNSVLHHAFDELEIGTQVRFESTVGNDGPQTTSVQIVGRPGVRARPRRGEVNPDLPAGWER